MNQSYTERLRNINEKANNYRTRLRPQHPDLDEILREICLISAEMYFHGMKRNISNAKLLKEHMRKANQLFRTKHI